MAAAAQPLRERVMFDMNVPVEIALDRDGNPTESTARDGSAEYRYFLFGHRIMWVPEAVHTTIQRAQAGDGAQFSVTKHRAPTPWKVVHIETNAPPTGHGYSNAPSPTPAAPPVQQQQQPAAAPPAAAPRPALDAPAQRHIDEPASDNGPMYGALCAAIRTAAAAEKFAASIGRSIAFETGDIRAIAATLYIHATGGGR
jgi:YD repeat-containing protein